MKIFGFEFGKRAVPTVTAEIVKVADDSPTIRPEIKGIAVPESKKLVNIPKIDSKVLTYSRMNATRGNFQTPEHDLALINRIIDTDSYCHQAFVKKVGLMFKEGFEFIGPNPKTIQYIKLRLAQISRATGIPTDEMLRSVGASLIQKSNAFLVKVRKESASGGKSRISVDSERELEPVAGYFCVAPETMSFEMNKSGKIVRWKQLIPNGQYKFFNPEDVVHLYFNRKEGFVWGTPTIAPVIDDIRSLRKIEENIELLVYQHLFPLFHYQVGTDDYPAGIDERGNSEIDVAKAEIQDMPAEGGLITSHRHKIQLIGAENRSLRAEGYLEHFKKRVFSGLGISAVDMGEGECYSSDTETLTENGWKFHWQIDHTKERIATYNPSSKRLEWNLANSKHESKYSGVMYEYTNFRVTPKHDLFLIESEDHDGKRFEDKPKKIWARDILGWKKHKQITSAVFSDKESEETELPESYYKLLGFVTASGFIHDDLVNIICVAKKDQFVLGDILRELDIPFDILGVKGTKYINVSFKNPYGTDLTRFFQTNGLEILKELDTMSIENRINYFSCFVENHPKSIRQTSCVSIKTNTKERDFIQILSLYCGFSSKIQGKSINISRKVEKDFLQFSMMGAQRIKKVQYSGTIFCYNVPNHLFVTRLNNKIAVHGNTANRSTSESMSRNLVDSVKDIQRVVESQFTDFVINELLQESNFGTDVLNEDSRVALKFREIDLDYQIKKENHMGDLYNKNIVSFHEARMGIGKQPMRIPSAAEIESDPDISDKYPEWFATFWKLIDEPKSLISSMDEPYTAAAKAAAASRSTTVTPAQVSESNSEQHAAAKELIQAKPMPAAKKKDSFLNTYYNMLESDTLNMVMNNMYSKDWLKQTGFMVQAEMILKLKTQTVSAFVSGYRTINLNSNSQIESVVKNRKYLEDRANMFVTKLIKQTVSAINRQDIDNLQKDDKIQKVKATFDALRFRSDLIEDTEIKKAFNFGKLEGARDSGKTEWTIEVDKDSCEMCKTQSKMTFKISETADLDQIPPFHPNSRSKLVIKEN